MLKTVFNYITRGTKVPSLDIKGIEVHKLFSYLLNDKLATRVKDIIELNSNGYLRLKYPILKEIKEHKLQAIVDDELIDVEFDIVDKHVIAPKTKAKIYRIIYFSNVNGDKLQIEKTSKGINLYKSLVGRKYLLLSNAKSDHYMCLDFSKKQVTDKVTKDDTYLLEVEYANNLNLYVKDVIK